VPKNRGWIIKRARGSRECGDIRKEMLMCAFRATVWRKPKDSDTGLSKKKKQNKTKRKGRANLSEKEVIPFKSKDVEWRFGAREVSNSFIGVATTNVL
jgi:hypothetical protein